MKLCKDPLKFWTIDGPLPQKSRLTPRPRGYVTYLISNIEVRYYCVWFTPNYSVSNAKATYSKCSSMLTSYNKRKYLCIALFVHEIQSSYLVTHCGFRRDDQNLVNL
uniref:Uncharacterized protein n=1 Tax=Romanomermis culicivorax TaxID=13658 RepID=A0A915K930_ROMCU